MNEVIISIKACIRIFLRFIVLLLLGSFLCSACNSQNNIITNKVKEKYPGARILEIEEENDGFEVEFIYKNQEHEAEYDRDGNWLLTETEITYTDLPDKIIEHIQEEYYDWEIEEIEIIKKRGVKKHYEIELEREDDEIRLFYEFKGRFEKSEKTKKKDTVTESVTIPSDMMKEDHKELTGYSLSHPDKKIDMPLELLEISGVEVIDEHSIACVQDEKGIVYIYDIIEHKISRTIHFGTLGDYEDIGFNGSELYILRSDARLFMLKDMYQVNPTVDTYRLTIGCLNNEGLYCNRNNESIIIASKSRMVSDKNIDNRYLSIFKKRGDEFVQEKIIKLDVNKIKAKLPRRIARIKFNPSAVAMHPETGELYIVSSSDRLLVVSDMGGNIKSAHILDPDLFFQPEGIAFFKNGDMLISNEGKQKTNDPQGNILLFRFNDLDR